MEEQPKVYTAKEVAQILRITVQAVYIGIRAKRIPAFKVGGNYRISGAALDRMLSDQAT